MSWLCRCEIEHPDRTRLCTECQSLRPFDTAAPSGSAPSPRCASCQEPTRSSQLTRGEDGAERCAGCHIGYLRDRAAKDPIRPEDRARCKARLAELFKETKRARD